MSFLDSIANDNDMILSDWGETVTVGGVDITAIFTSPFEQVSVGNQVVEMTAHQLTCKTSDVSGVQQGTEVVVRGTSYVVIDVQPTDLGLTVLALEVV